MLGPKPVPYDDIVKVISPSVHSYLVHVTEKSQPSWYDVIPLCVALIFNLNEPLFPNVTFLACKSAY